MKELEPRPAGGRTTLYYFGQLIWKIFRFVLFLCLTFVILYPLIFMLSMALRQPSDLFDPSVSGFRRKSSLKTSA